MTSSGQRTGQIRKFAEPRKGNRVWEVEANALQSLGYAATYLQQAHLPTLMEEYLGRWASTWPGFQNPAKAVPFQ